MSFHHPSQGQHVLVISGSLVHFGTSLEVLNDSVDGMVCLDLEWLALKKFRDAKCSAAHITEANWNLKMRHARCFILKNPARTTREGLTGLGNVHIAESVRYVLNKGPKYSHEPLLLAQ
ncbi:uncharacterized protein LOC142776541 [Rhipicephalus microplus]|uniref:uncharacterized protein LOC142776541 n=1 Tax=Rhipicephalus microplus TaxID=6941 RepID=UPI003F6CCC2A